MRTPHGGPGPPSDEGPSDLLGPQWGQLSICLSSQIINPLDPLGAASQDSLAPALVPEGTFRPPAMEVLWKVCLRQKHCMEANVSQRVWFVLLDSLLAPLGTSEATGRLKLSPRRTAPPKELFTVFSSPSVQTLHHLLLGCYGCLILCHICLALRAALVM